MAANEPQSYAETLREMRTTRMQQLRQGNSQAQIMNKQMIALTAMNNLLSKQVQAISRLESSQRSSNQQLVSVNRNLSTLSTTLSRSLSNFAASVVMGAGRGAGAVGGAIAGTAGAAGSIATSIASGIGSVLPAAIAGYVVKSVAWDNMSQQTRDRISGSMGNLFNKAFKEIDSTELGHTLTKALTPAFQQIKNLAGKAGEKVEAVRESLPSASEARYNIEKGLSKAEIKARANYETGRGVVEGISSVLPSSVPGLPGVSASGAVNTVGAVAATAGAVKIIRGSPGATTSQGKATANLNGFKKRPTSKATEEALKVMKKNGLKGKEGLLASRMIVKASSGAGAAVKFLEAFKKYKLAASGAFVILGAVLHYWDYKELKKEIELMAEEDIFNQQEVDFLVGRLQAEEWARFFGGAVVGTLGAVGGSAFGPAGTVGGGLAGSALGSEVAGSAAGAAYEKMNPRPKSLDEDVSAKLSGSTRDIANKAFDVRYDQKHAKPNEVPQANMSPTLRPNLDDLPIEQVMGQYRDIVGQKEGGATGYDAMYGVNKESDVQKYMKDQTGGKRLTEMTIDEAIALQEKKKGTNTGAMGKYQFMNLKKAAEMAGLKGNELMSGENQDKMFDAYTKDNAKTLKNLNVPVNAFTLRLAHAVGPAGAKKLLDANPNALPADVLGFAEGSAKRGTNPQLSKKGVTVASYLSSIGKEVGGIGGTQMASASPADSTAKPDAGTATTATQTVQAGSEQKPAETEDDKRKNKIADMFQKTADSMDPEKLTSDLLEKLEIAKTIMMGSGGSGGTTVINNDNSVNSSGGGGSSPPSSQGKGVVPDNVRSNIAHSSMTGLVR